MYLGNQPAVNFTSFAKQDFSTSSTTTYTLDHAVANANELALFINNVRQEPTTAYSANSNTLTLTEATSSSDDMYAIFLGKAIQTVNPPNNSVNEAQLNYPLTTFSSTGIDDNASSNAITIDNSQRVGIGTTSPSYPLEVNGTVRAVGTNNLPALVVDGNSTDEGDIAVLDNQVLTFGHHTLDGNSGGFTERMRIKSDGDVLIGTTSFSSGSRGKQFEINNNAVALRSGCSVTTTAYHNEFHNPNGAVGSIRTFGSSTSFNTSSDYRLKENVNYDFNATTRLKQLKPARFNFIADADTTVDGFLAHEVQSVVPEAISGEKDAVKEDGTPEYQGIDQSKLVPLLVKTIQELEARITELENK